MHPTLRLARSLGILLIAGLIATATIVATDLTATAFGVWAAAPVFLAGVYLLVMVAERDVPLE